MTFVAFMENARAKCHRLYAWCNPFCTPVKRKVTDFMESKTRTSDASFQNGLLQAFLTCVVLAPIPLMYWLWLLNASFWLEVPLWYGLVLFMNVPEKMMTWKTIAQCMFIAAVCLLWFFQYRHWSWACLMCSLSRLRMNGKGKVTILWQLRMEVEMWEFARTMIKKVFCALPTMSPEKKVEVVKANDMICNPNTFLLCAMVAFKWEAWHNAGFDVNLRDWTRIVSCRRAFVPLNLWRFVVFVLPYCLYVLARHFWPATVETVDREFDQSTVKPESDGNLTEEEYKIWNEFFGELLNSDVE